LPETPQTGPSAGTRDLGRQPICPRKTTFSCTQGDIENQHGEQAVFIYDRGQRAVLHLGDAGWEMPHEVVDGAAPDLILSETERLWVRACWQAATANRQEV